MSQIVNFTVRYDGNFQLIEVVDDYGDTYTLDGVCSQCGECCINPIYNVGFNDENGRCSKLISEIVDGKEIFKCSIYANRPVGCCVWPTYPEEILQNPSCTLRLVKK